MRCHLVDGLDNMLVAIATVVLTLGAVSADMGGENPPTGTCLCVDGSGVNVRSGPGLQYEVIGTANTGECYKYTGSKLTTDDGIAWYRIDYSGREGWMSGQFLNIEDADRCSGGGSGPFPDGIKLQDSQARSFLNNNGISVYSSGGCSDRYNPSCTSLEQVRSNSVNGMVRFKEVSDCSVTVTGGTETGHAGGEKSHWNGWKLDTSLTPCIDGYVEGNYQFIGNRPGDGAPQYRDNRGNIFAKEGNHWDITFECTDCR